MPEALVLRALTEQDEAAFHEGLRMWDAKDPHEFVFGWKLGTPFGQLLETLRKNSQGLDLPEGWVPGSMFYGFVGGRIVGRVSLRHRLNDELKRRGGHIGYAVAPAFRRKGYGTQLLESSFPFCRQVGIKDLMLTCADDNEASWKVIEKCGGRLEDRVWDDVDKETIRRYWIKLA